MYLCSNDCLFYTFIMFALLTHHLPSVLLFLNSITCHLPFTYSKINNLILLVPFSPFVIHLFQFHPLYSIRIHDNYVLPFYPSIFSLLFLVSVLQLNILNIHHHSFGWSLSSYLFDVMKFILLYISWEWIFLWYSWVPYA